MAGVAFVRVFVVMLAVLGDLLPDLGRRQGFGHAICSLLISGRPGWRPVDDHDATEGRGVIPIG
jgi:hypothetical protein